MKPNQSPPPWWFGPALIVGMMAAAFAMIGIAELGAG